MRQVRDYLRADGPEAERRLAPLATRSPAELERALRRLLADPSFWRSSGVSPATGLLPGQSIQVGNRTHRYGLYVPSSYRPERAYPLMLCLHGAGFNGDSYLERWQPRLGEEYLLACPSIEGGAWWTREGEALVLAVLDEVMRRYRVDPDRVALTGMSNGGLGAYLVGLYHADRFAGLAPMAAPFPRGFYPLFENGRHTPFYLIHGEQDQVIPVFYSRDAADYLRREGYAVVYREHGQVHPMAGGHFFPRDELPQLVDWLHTQQRAPRPDRVVAVLDRDHTGRFHWIRLDAIDPAVASFWSSEQNAEEARRLEAGVYARLSAQVRDNDITVETTGVHRYTLLLSPDLVDLSRPVRVTTNGRVSFDGPPVPDSRLLLEEARRRLDPSRLVWAEITIDVP